ncbi:TPA: hypothetical protein ACS7ZY_001209 [Providencia alcalifaciens]
MDSKMSLAVQSVIDLHVVIEDVFTGRNQEESLPLLLNSFDPDFKMITIQGQGVTHKDVITLFSQHAGKKPNLTIVTQQIVPIQQLGDDCWVQYQELQTNDGVSSLRVSTACIHVENEKCIWKYLHETPVK